MLSVARLFFIHFPIPQKFCKKLGDFTFETSSALYISITSYVTIYNETYMFSSVQFSLFCISTHIYKTQSKAEEYGHMEYVIATYYVNIGT